MRFSLSVSLVFVLGSAVVSSYFEPASAAGNASARFFAQAEVQARVPMAFALQPESFAGVQAMHALTLADADRLFAALQAEEGLVDQLLKYAEHSLPQQKDLLQRVFQIECESMGIASPELVLDEEFSRGAYFDFDVNHPGPGKVIINPRPSGESAGALEEALIPLALLMHETRHSAQFQAAQGLAPASPLRKVAVEFAAAFQAQKDLAGQLFYLDFMTLNNEYEAFRFGNYVLGRMTGFSVDPITMGSYASQFSKAGNAKIDLVDLAHQPGPRSVLERFNQLEQAQYELLYP